VFAGPAFGDLLAMLVRELQSLLDDLWGALTPAQRAIVTSAFVRLSNALLQLGRLGLSRATILAVKAALDELLVALSAAGVRRQLITYFLQQFRAIVARFITLAGGAAGAAAARLLLVLLVAYISHVLAEWAFNQKIPGTQQTYKEYYAESLFRLFASGLITCNELQAEVLRRKAFLDRLVAARAALTDPEERELNKAAILTAAVELAAAIDVALRLCPDLPERNALGVLRRDALKKAAEIGGE
jgi:hypothetical protein